MSKGISLHIGLNHVDPAHYQGWSGPLTACEADANSIQDIASTRGFVTQSLLTKAATRQCVKDQLKAAANSLNSGDILLLSYSGHGGQLPDLNGDEADQQDETWCLYDGQLVDDELYALLGLFRAGVRILVLSDSCHSGTVAMMLYYSNSSTSQSLMDSKSPVYRAMPNEVAMRVYQANKATYDPILSDPQLRNTKSQVQASVLLLSGCQDNQLSQDGAFNGVFTGKLLRVWNGGAFVGTYRDFYKKIKGMMLPDQTPNYFTAGATNTKFEEQPPFMI